MKFAFITLMAALIQDASANCSDSLTIKQGHASKMNVFGDTPDFVG